MTTTRPDLRLLGAQPEIIGHACTGLVVQHFYEGRTLVDQANVTYLRFAGTWHRVYFEPGTVFWRTGQAPVQAVNSTLEHGLLLNDLSELPSVAGRILLAIEYATTDIGDVEVQFSFQGQGVVRLRYNASADCTQIDA